MKAVDLSTQLVDQYVPWQDQEIDPFRRSRWSVIVRYRLLPWWARILIIWCGARAITTIFLLILAAAQPPNGITPGHPDFFTFSNIWDAGWYKRIAFFPYPAQLPISEDGHVTENAWAFLPGYPNIVAIFHAAGIPWEIAAVLVSFSAGLGAAFVLYRLLSRFVAGQQAMFAVVLFAVAPVSPVMQVGYAESVGFLLLASALLLLADRRYGWLLIIIPIWAFTRPGEVAFALTVAIHWVVRWVQRTTVPFPMRDQIMIAGVGFVSGVAGLVWPVIAWMVTGNPQAYTQTELAWRSGYVGYGDLTFFSSWFQGANFWATYLGLPSWLGTVVVLILIAGFAVSLFLPAVRKLGPDIRGWLASYALYLLAVFFPQSSTFRILAPMFPLVGAMAAPRSQVYRVAIVILCLTLQFIWLYACWYISPADWSPP